MPFTLSHAVAVLPLATGRPARWLVPAALVIGSWIPDLPYFVPLLRGSDWSHAASGPLTIDLALGLTVFLAWQLFFRRPLVDLAPRWLAERVPEAPRLSVRRLGWAAVSVVIGATTHVVWDMFSHHDRWGTRHVGWLNNLLGPLPAYKWFQFGSGVLGLAVVGLWLVGWLRRTDARPLPSGVSDAARRRAWLAVLTCFAVAVAVFWRRGIDAGSSTEAVAFGVATGAIGATMGAAVVACLVWQVLSSSSRRL